MEIIKFYLFLYLIFVIYGYGLIFLDKRNVIKIDNYVFILEYMNMIYNYVFVLYILIVFWIFC